MAEQNTSIVTGGLGYRCTSSLVEEDSREAVSNGSDCMTQLGSQTSSVTVPNTSEINHSVVPRVRQLRTRKASENDIVPIEHPPRGRKTKATGKSKAPWSKSERIILWECFVRSGGKRSGGYIKKVENLWRELGVNVRATPSLISQLKAIETNGLLSLIERREIERKVNEGETNGTVDMSAHEYDDLPIITDEVLPEPVVEEETEILLEPQAYDTWKCGDLTRALEEHEKQALDRLRQVYHNDEKEIVPNLKSIDKRRVMKEVEFVNCILHNLITTNMDVTMVNHLLYAGSFIVAERLGLTAKKGNKKKQEQKKPFWQRRIENSIVQWRKHLSWVEEHRKGNLKNNDKIKELNHKYAIREKGALAVSSLLKGKIKSGATKIKNYVKSQIKIRQNTLFKNNQSQLYKELSNGNKPPETGEVPDAKEATDFWKNIWSVEKQHDSNASWLPDIHAEYQNIQKQDNINITIEDATSCIRKMTNWKAPGPDGVRGFWFKKFHAAHEVITSALQACLQAGEVPSWMVKGRTVLIQKDPSKGKIASNYRPIACLPLMWKLLTGVFSEKLYKHLVDNNLLPDEQKGCRKRSRGTKDQLLIDKTILREVKRVKRNLAVGWIDYRKAYDMVPHSWIREVLTSLKIADNVSDFLINSMVGWSTTLTSNGENLGDVDINRGIFQGDSLSPLLFVMAMIPLTTLLRKESMGYRFSKSKKQINHLLFMDDLKLYAKDEADLDKLINVVSVFSRDIGMEFGLDKCAVLVMKRGIKARCEGIQLPDGRMMEALDDDGYKYLGVLEGADIKQKEMKEKIKKEYLRRVKLVSKSMLYGGNLIKAINAWAVSVVRYSAGVIEWSKAELKAMDIKTRKILTMHGAFHEKSSTYRLYLKRKEGGRGLISVTDCVTQEVIGLTSYVHESKEWMLQIVGKTLEPVDETTDQFKKRVNKERLATFKEKKLHGRFMSDIEGIADDRTWQWLQGGYLAKSTEAFIIAAQEQAIRTRYIRAKIDGEEIDYKCRLCGQKPETVPHIVSACSKIAQTSYHLRHDRMGLRVYWELCKKYGLDHSEKWYEEIPNDVRVSEDGKTEIWWDKDVHTTEVVGANRPDLTLINHEEKVWTFVDFAVPWDTNIETTETEKVEKYKPLASNIQKLHKVRTKTIPIVVGCLGTIPTNLVFSLQELDIPDVIGSLQTSALIGTANILRRTLSL